MELHQLRYFVAVAETGNFTRAAKRCFVSQPSLSQQIQKLEDELGHPLFDRLGRRAELTPAGRAFVTRARRILIDVDDAARAVREQSGGGRVRLGMVPSVAPYLLPELLPRLAEAVPEAELEVFEDFRTYLAEQVVRGNLEAAVLSLPPDDLALETELLIGEPLLVAMPKGHSLANKADLSLRDLAGQPFIMLGDSSSLALQTRRFFGDNDLGLAVIARCAQVKTLKTLVAAGIGLAIVPKMAVGRDKVPGIVYREMTDAHPRRELMLVRHAERFHGRTEEAVAEVVRKVCRDIFGAPEPAAGGPGGAMR